VTKSESEAPLLTYQNNRFNTTTSPTPTG